MPERIEELQAEVRILRAENSRLRDYMRTAVQELAAVDDDDVFAPRVREYVHDTVVALSHALRTGRPVPTSRAQQGGMANIDTPGEGADPDHKSGHNQNDKEGR